MTGYLRTLGLDVAGWLSGVGIDLVALHDSNACVPISTIMDAWRRAEVLCGDPSVGMRVVGATDLSPMERLQHETEWPVVQLSLLSATVGEMLERMARYFPAAFYGSQITLERRDGAVHMRHTVHVDEGARGYSEFILGLCVRMIHDLSNRRAAPQWIRFAHAAPPSLDVYERVMPARVHFSAGENAILLDERGLDLPLRSPNPRLAAEIARHADEALARLPPLETFVEKVRALIEAELCGGNPNADHIASSLQMSTRTLSRRLEETGTSHKALLDDVRARLARHYLVNERRSVAEVCRLLGFSEVSAFHRAFKRWYGVSPAHFRREPGGEA